MIESLIWAILATSIVSLMSLVGIITLAIKRKILDKILLWLVGFAAGALMGGAFFHLIPESTENSSVLNAGIFVIIGFSLFFVIERVLYWRHCHEGVCEVHTLTYMNLIGDSVHNFIDGLVIAGSFIINVSTGIATTIAILAHEIPQEMGDFGVLVYGGFSRLKALMFNFITALTAVVGAIVGFLLVSITDSFIPLLLAFAAGGFIYIASSDLVPELHKEPKLHKSIISFIFFLLGVAFMYGIKIIFEH